ncbi:MAG: hypothetical protein V4631_15380 [Pseudomonadota bacterium]
MVKRFLRLLIVALTLQFAWGVASAYCGHESGTASQHFGHHAHQHQGAGGDDVDDDGGTTPSSKIGADSDCATCAHAPAGVGASASTPIIVAVVSHEFLPALIGRPAPYLGAPERPQWSIAV